MAAPGVLFSLETIALSTKASYSVPRETFIDELASHGALVVSNVNSHVTALVSVKDDACPNVASAKKWNVPVVTEAWVRDSIKAGVVQPPAKYLTDGVPPYIAPPVTASPVSSPPTPVSTPAPALVPVPAPAPAPAAKTDKKRKAEDDKAAPSGNTVKMIKKGHAVVDVHCSVHSKVHVYEEGSDIYDGMLNQTNIGQNNNKFYVIQLLESDDKKSYYCWNRWGRVGATGQSKLQPHGSSLSAAKNDFAKKFRDKTGNEWANRANFQSKKGKYTLLDIDYGSDEDDGKDVKAKLEAKKQQLSGLPPSKIDPRTQDFVKLICNVTMMENSLKELEFDIQKMPLGKLKKSTIEKGYKVLKQIESIINSGGSKGTLSDLSSEFYTLVPHAFGMRVPPLIGNVAMLQEKMAMLEALGDIEIATTLLKAADDKNVSEHPIDAHYRALKTDIKPLARDGDMFKLLDKYLHQTHASTHTNYTLEILDIFEVEREGEKNLTAKSKQISNHMLLWHGSRLTNWVGILSQGLRIAPPEAPVTGYMFGKGVYFADMSSKSANYCCTSKQNPTGIMILSDVALGKTYDLTGANFIHKLPPGFESTKGLGKTLPNPSENVTLPDGVVVPVGKGVPSNVPATSLLYNEFIVYDVAQISIRYLFKLKFHYK